MKIQIVFYSMYGHIHQMAEAVATGAREVPGAEVSLFQVAELVPEAVLEKMGAKAAPWVETGGRPPQKPDGVSIGPRGPEIRDQGCRRRTPVLPNIPQRGPRLSCRARPAMPSTSLRRFRGLWSSAKCTKVST